MRISYPRFDREELIALLRHRIPALREELSLVRVVLFGSWATGRHTAASDIDLLVVYGGSPRAGAYGLVRRTLDVRGLEPHVYAESECGNVESVIARMVRDGIVLIPESGEQHTAPAIRSGRQENG